MAQALPRQLMLFPTLISSRAVLLHLLEVDNGSTEHLMHLLLALVMHSVASATGSRHDKIEHLIHSSGAHLVMTSVALPTEMSACFTVSNATAESSFLSWAAMLHPLAVNLAPQSIQCTCVELNSPWAVLLYLWNVCLFDSVCCTCPESLSCH